MKTLFILLIILTSKVFSANEFLSIIKKSLPEPIISNDLYLKTEIKKVEFYATINPDLIYVYMEYLDKKLNRKIANPDSNWSRYFGYLLNKSKRAKSEWAHRIINYINQREILPLAKEKLKSYFYPYTNLDYQISVMQDTLVLPPSGLDRNKQAYFTFISLLPKNIENYDPENDYITLLNTELKRIAAFYEENYKKLEVIGKHQRDALIKQALAKYSFIFKNSYLPKFERANIQLADFILKSLLKDYRNHFEFTVGYAIDQFNINFKDIITFKDLYNQTFNYSMKVKNKNYVQFGVKFPMISKLVPFSFITIKAGYSTYSKPDYKKEVDIGHIIRYDGELYINGTYKLVNFRDIKSYSIQLQAMIPIFFVTRNFYFGAGADYKYYTLSFKYDYYFDGYVINYNTKEIPEFYNGWTKTVEKHQRHQFTPLINVNYILFNLLEFNLNFFIPKDLRFSLNIFKRL